MSNSNITSQLGGSESIFDFPTLSFGKYKGKTIDEIPDDYLYWLLEQTWFHLKFGDWIIPIRHELVDRKKKLDKV
jgi:uncharacterized protein (DUF3820 family)